MDNVAFDFEARDVAIKNRQRRLAQMIRDQAQFQQDPGRMVSGHYVAPSWAQSLNAAVAPVLDRQRIAAEEAGLERDVGEFNAADRRAAIAHAMNAPGTQGPASPETTAQWEQEGLAIPSRKAVIEKVVADRLVNAPIREEERAFRRGEAEANRADRAAGRTEALQAREEELRLRLEDRNLDRQSREQMAREMRALQAQIAAQASQDRRYAVDNRPGSADKPPKPLPAAQSKAWIENNTALGKVDDALAALAKNPDAVGLKTLMPDVALQRIDPEGVAARAAIADLGSLRIHDRSGAAVTAAEFPRLRPFIPNATDNAKTVKTKLENFKREYELIQQEILNYAQDQGYNPPPLPRGSGTPQTAAPVRGGPKVGDVDGGYRYKGGDPSKASSWEKVR